MNPLAIVILAAGRGKRMNSVLPKVLQPLAGRPLLGHVLQTAAALNPSQCLLVHGHGAEAVREAFAATPLTWVLQEPQLGTGHAVRQCLPHLGAGGTVLVLYGDVPLIGADTLQRLLAAAGQQQLGLLTVQLAQPAGYGRIVRNAAGAIQRIVEDRDANAAERAITEVNTGIMAIPAARLAGWLDQLSCDNAQQEYYLTDLVALAIADGVAVEAVQPASPDEVLGVNDRRQLAALERIAQRQIAELLLNQGVTLFDPARLDVRGSLRCGRDVQIDVNCVFEGDVELADGVVIGAHCVIRQSRIGAGTRIAPFSHLDGAVVAAQATVGPFARLRPGAELGDQVHIGNFVEVKKSRIGQGSKVNHLTYIGDTDIGAGVNVGAGTITCNYDGVNKHRTVIEDNVFVGSGCMLVAPVTIGQGATLGAGSTITKDAPADALTVTRAKQISIPGWQRPRKI